ncbi:hypothetical protein, partial [Salmonella sp. gx-f7]|uniref:hypothetical protein n=1 Tax=Salmonella sp. gx-f7 TaxID=2582606 RepID=UPI001F42C5C2
DIVGPEKAKALSALSEFSVADCMVCKSCFKLSSHYTTSEVLFTLHNLSCDWESLWFSHYTTDQQQMGHIL